ncbi:LysE family translocator [Pseudoruegeria sp. HB172150]|uniref:LysE family translocator n=1 Tax=Pseudoruegeria sp. HB172150 TaxID=2721164 RepID=UPI001555F5D6|nr:LysE family translocator [Pseudoruegeria sp. HB172150]
MDMQYLPALALFSLVQTGTPGPNNLMLLASGANFGYRRTVPHILGIACGMAVMILLVGMGLMRAFDAVPVLYTVLKAASVTYLLWLAWKIAHAAPPEGRDTTGRPMTLLQAALFQWVNPKAWSMVLAAITLYAPGRDLTAVGIVIATFFLISIPVISVWTAAGQQARRLLSNPARIRTFNWTMAGLLVLSLVPVLLH